jgi:hypothetical protein
MLITLPRWNDHDAYYSQTNNVVETILAKTGANRKLETCGPTAAVMLIEALGPNMILSTSQYGHWMMQPEDVLACWFNDPRNYDAMRKVRGDVDPATIMGNEVPQWYEAAIPAVFGVKAKFAWGLIANIQDALEEGRGVLATMEKPGHYIAIVGYDTDTQEVIYHDPWPGNRWPLRYADKPGRCRRLTVEEQANLKPYRVEVG